MMREEAVSGNLEAWEVGAGKMGSNSVIVKSGNSGGGRV